MKETFNSGIYGEIVSVVVTDNKDYLWLCNQMAKLYKQINDDCTDSYRVSTVDSNGCWSKEYESKITCCGQSDLKVKNKITGNSFWIGFNYGH